MEIKKPRTIADIRADIEDCVKKINLLEQLIEREKTHDVSHGRQMELLERSKKSYEAALEKLKAEEKRILDAMPEAKGSTETLKETEPGE